MSLRNFDQFQITEHRLAAMAGLSDLNSFVGKFLNLWQSGRDASLHLKTCDGKATVNLQLGLGQAPPPPSSEPPPRHVPGPSRQRRTQRRALARQQAEQAEQAQAKTDEEEAAENANEKVEKDESESGVIATDVVEHINTATEEVTVVDEATSEKATAAEDIIIRD